MSKRRKKKKEKGLSQTQRQILAVVLIGLAVILFLSQLELAGIAGEFLALGMEVVFGWAGWALPIVLIGAALFLLNYEKIQEIEVTRRRPLCARFLGLGLLILALAGSFHVRLIEEPAALIQGKGGGYLGFGLAFILARTFGNFASFLIFGFIFIIGLVIVFSGIWRWPKIRIRREEGIKEQVFARKKLLPRQEEILEEKTPEPEQRKKIALLDIIPRSKLKGKIDLPLSLLDGQVSLPTSGNIKANKLLIQKTLENFGILVEMGEVKVGPTVTQYTLRPDVGIKLSRITALHNDLSLALAAHPIRIEAPIPGESLVGVEVPNRSVAVVKLKEILAADIFKKRKSNLTIALGKDVANNIWLADLGRMPHLLIAGATGSGKTISIKSIITSLLYQNSPEDLRLILIDPKRVEFTLFNNLPHLLCPVITKVDKTINALKWALEEMERRFDIMGEAKKRDIYAYNHEAQEKLPFIVIVIDELADLMVANPHEVEGAIIRLAQMARATGIHLIVATQRPSVDIITGLIKANITSRIAFSVASMIDSRTILDFSGAEKLLGRGDMLFISPQISKPKRLQGAYVSDEELKHIVGYLTDISQPHYEDGVTEARAESGEDLGILKKDEMLSQARVVVIQAGRASASLLQRRLRVGYARAARLLDLLEEEGTIGPLDGAKPREVYKGLGPKNRA